MRRINFFSIPRFFSVTAGVNAVNFFSSRCFDVGRSENEKNELLQLSQLPWQEWKNNGLDPVRFVQGINDRRFYLKDRDKLRKILINCCWMLIQCNVTDMDSMLSKITNKYAGIVLGIILANADRCNLKDDCRYDRYLAKEEKLYNLEKTADEILATIPDEKKVGMSFDMFKTLRTLFYFTRDIESAYQNNSKNSSEFPRMR